VGILRPWDDENPIYTHTRIPRRKINEKERIEEKPHFWCNIGVF